jgi:hypothetical protein
VSEAFYTRRGDVRGHLGAPHHRVARRGVHSRHQVVWPPPGPPPSLFWTPSRVGENRNFGICFIQFRDKGHRVNNSFRQIEANMFNDTINDIALIELLLNDRAFTWSNNRNIPTLQRLDRAFINIAWNDLFSNLSLSSLTRFVSDHVSLIASISTNIPRPTCFRFENS